MELLDIIFLSALLSLLIITMLSIKNVNNQIIIFLSNFNIVMIFVLLKYKKINHQLNNHQLNNQVNNHQVNNQVNNHQLNNHQLNNNQVNNHQLNNKLLNLSNKLFNEDSKPSINNILNDNTLNKLFNEYDSNNTINTNEIVGCPPSEHSNVNANYNSWLKIQQNQIKDYKELHNPFIKNNFKHKEYITKDCTNNTTCLI